VCGKRWEGGDIGRGVGVGCIGGGRKGRRGGGMMLGDEWVGLDG
jgi:hypothetical protein